MKKAYLIFPLVALLVFFGFYWNFSSTYEAKEEAKVKALRAQKDEKMRKDAQDREKAIKEALAAQEVRKKAKAEKEAKDRADHEARQLAVEARDKASREQQKFERQVEKLQKEIKLEQDAIAKIEDDKKKAIEEQAFLRTYVKQAEANVASLRVVLDKIAAADAAAEAAAKAAALAAAKK